MKKTAIGIGAMALMLLVGVSAANAMTPATQSAEIIDLKNTIATSQLAHKMPKVEHTNGYMPFNPYGNVNTFGFPFMYGMYPYGMGNFGYGNGYGGYMNGVRAPITNRWISNIDTYRLGQIDENDEGENTCPECKRITWQNGPFVMHSWVYGDCCNCTNCENCLFCENCEDCENCFNCKDCKNCTNIANAIGWVNNEPCEDCIPYDENEEGISDNVDESQIPQTLEIKPDEVVEDNLLETHATEIQPRAPHLTKDIKEPAEYLNHDDNIATMDENSIFNENEHENNKALTS